MLSGSYVYVKVVREAIFAESAVEQHRDKVHRIASQPKPPDVAAFLRQALAREPMIHDLEPRQLQRLVDAMEPHRLQPREVCVRGGEPNDYLYILQSGQVRVAGGKEERVLQPGDAFGQAALSVGAPADFSATATGAAQLWRLHRVAFKVATRLELTQPRAFRSPAREFDSHRSSSCKWTTARGSARPSAKRRASIDEECLAGERANRGFLPRGGKRETKTR